MNKEADEVQTISRFEHENDLMHYGRVNKRSLIAIITVCVTCIILTAINVISYTIRDTIREQNWLDALSKIAGQSVGVAADGVYQQPNP